jgi:hypothetical protein
MLTELEATNLMLSAIGESPVSSLEIMHPDVLSSRLLLKHSIAEILEPGKWFNTERRLFLNINAAGEIVLPGNTLSVDPVDTRLDYIERNGRLYDMGNHTFIFSAGVHCDVSMDMPFAELPFVAQNLALYNAAHALQANFIGDTNKLQNLTSRLALARKEFNKAELRSGDYNARNSPTAQKLLRGMRTAL